MTPSTTAERFWTLFRGSSKSHGVYWGETQNPASGKMEIKDNARTIKTGGATPDDWSKHLTGWPSLGIVAIQEDSTCWWGAIDVDDYRIDHAELSGRLRELTVPAIVCKTKSSGAHVYLFFSEPIPAVLLRNRLRELAVLLGRSDQEIFPKQDSFETADRVDFGNWLNMPYHQGDNEAGVRYAVLPDGRGLSVERFLTIAESQRMTRAHLLSLNLRREASDFASGPPCLEHLSASGIPDGQRNNALYNYAILAKKMFPDDWEVHLHEWNSRLMKPPLLNAEVQDVIRRHRKKDFFYKCKDPPIASCCNSNLCRTRPHGVSDGKGGAAADIEELDRLCIIFSDPKRYRVSLKAGGSIECYVEELADPNKFKLMVMGNLQRVLPDYPKNSWNKTLTRLFSDPIEEPVSPDSGLDGQFREVLDTFLGRRNEGSVRDDVLTGAPWWDEDAGRVLFLLSGLEKEIDLAKFSSGEKASAQRAWLTAKLRSLGGESRQTKIKGLNRHVWYLPAADYIREQDASLDLPRHEESPL